MPNDVEHRKSGALHPMHTVGLVVVGVVGVIIAFGVLHFVAGIVWAVVKVAVILVVLAGLLWLLLGRRRR